MSKTIKIIFMFVVICGLTLMASGCALQTASTAGNAVVLQQPILQTEQMEALDEWFATNCKDESPVVALPDELLVQYEVCEALGQGSQAARYADQLAGAEAVSAAQMSETVMVFKAAEVTADYYGDIIRNVLNYRAEVDVLEAKPAFLMHEVEYIVINQEFDLGGFLAELAFDYVDVVDNYAIYRARYAFFEEAGDDGEFAKLLETIDLKEDCIELDLPEITKEYELLFISDMHIQALDDMVSEDNVATVKDRYYNLFHTDKQLHSADNWMILSSALDYYEADGIVFGGDMMDFVSQTNIDLLKKGLSKLDTPYMYLRADHDLGIWYSGYTLDAQDAYHMHEQVNVYEDVYVMEYPDFYVLGWNNSTDRMTEAGLQVAKEIWDDGKPIILATHVPLNSIVDNSLFEASASVDPQGRSKLWGMNCLYYPEDSTLDFLGMVYAENSPVAAVLSGHLHFKYTVQLTEGITEYVFAPAFEGRIARVRIY